MLDMRMMYIYNSVDKDYHVNWSEFAFRVILLTEGEKNASIHNVKCPTELNRYTLV